MVSSPEDAIYVNLRTNEEFDLDDLTGIGLLKQIIYEKKSKSFFLLANSLEGRLGFFVLKFPEDDPNNVVYLMRYLNKLDIGDPNMFILRNKEKGFKELIVSYKSIYINVYNIVCMDISV